MIHFICVNYNGSGITAEFLESLAAQDGAKGGEDFNAWVVDNASDESDFHALRATAARFPWAEVVRSQENVGYFRGLNIGIAACGRGADDWLVVGNNDLAFEADFCKVLARYQAPDRALVIAPDVVTLDGYHQNPHCVQRVGRVRKLLYQLYFSSYAAARLLSWGSSTLKKWRGGRRNAYAGSARRVHMGIGACYVLTPEFFAACNQLDPRIFMYGEEALLAGQVSAVGGITFYEPRLKVRHLESATVTKLPSRRLYEYARTSFPIYRDYL